MVRKIVSSGQTGVELAALDAAMKLGITHGGWTPRGRRNDAGILPEAYTLAESPSLGFQHAMELNVLDADGTLLITRGQKTSETRYAVEMALKHQRQLLHTDLRQHPLFEAASLLSSWIALQQIKTLFVTGTKASDEAEIYLHTQKIIETAFYLGFVKSGLHPEHGRTSIAELPENPANLPRSVTEAVERLKAVLPLKDRALLSNMQSNEIDHLRNSLGGYIKQNFGLYTGNAELLQSCAKTGQLVHPLPDEACAVILRALWENLQKTHKLRRVK